MMSPTLMKKKAAMLTLSEPRGGDRESDLRQSYIGINTFETEFPSTVYP
jgi:hypothetical protein